jgi:hypothetical protein
MRLAAVPLSALRASPHSDLPGQTCPCGHAGSDGPALALLPIYGSLPPVPPLVFDDMGPYWAGRPYLPRLPAGRPGSRWELSFLDRYGNPGIHADGRTSAALSRTGTAVGNRPDLCAPAAMTRPLT